MGRMDSISEQYDLVIAQRIQNLVVVLDERLLPVFIELVGDDIGLVIFEIEAVQQRNQSRAAFVSEAEFLRNERGRSLFTLMAVFAGKWSGTQVAHSTAAWLLVRTNRPEIPPNACCVALYAECS